MFNGLREEIVGICARMADYEENVMKYVALDARAEVKANIDAIRNRCNELLRHISTLKNDDLDAREDLVVEMREIRKKAVHVYWPEKQRKGFFATI